MSAINVGDIVVVKVTFHWQLQMFLNTLSSRRQNTPLLQHPNFSQAKRFLPCKITSFATRGLYVHCHSGNKTNFLHVHPNVRMHQHVSHSTA